MTRVRREMRSDMATVHCRMVAFSLTTTSGDLKEHVYYNITCWLGIYI